MSAPLLQVMGFALRNVFRHRLRSAATLAAISLGVAGLILAGGFVQDIFVQLGEAVIHSQSGHLQIVRKGYREERLRAPERFLIEQPDDLKREIMTVPGVQRTFSRLAFTGVANNGKRDLGIMGEGVEPAAEAALGTYLRYVEGRPLSENDLDGIVIGQGVAKSLGLRTGDRVNLVISLSQGAVNTLDFEIVGIFQSFSKDFDARAIRIPIEAARTLMDTNAAHLIVVSLERTDDTEYVASALRGKLRPDQFELASWRELSDFYDKTRQLYDSQFGVLRLIILLMVLLSVANSINMTLFERTREFGTMLALGDRPRALFRLLMFESAFLGLLGAASGMLLGCVAAWVISAIGIPMPPPPNSNIGYTAYIRLLPIDVLTAGGIGFAASCLAALVPARRVSTMPLVDALRHG